MLNRALVFRTFLFGFLCIAYANAALIPLQSSWKPEPGKAPPYYVWQNDPGLTEYLNGGVTGLCIPAAISNAFIYQYAFKADAATELKLPGIQVDALQKRNVDSNTLVRYFAKACHSSSTGATEIAEAANCIEQFYTDSGYKQSQVKLIRDLPSALSARVKQEQRAPTLQDIKTALAQGYEVIASVVTMSFDQTTNAWTKRGSHSFNVYGLNGDQLIVSNPTRAYVVNNVDAVFDLATIKDLSSSIVPPKGFSSLSIEGRLINRPGMTTFLAGLTLMKAQ